MRNPSLRGLLSFYRCSCIIRDRKVLRAVVHVHNKTRGCGLTWSLASRQVVTPSLWYLRG